MIEFWEETLTKTLFFFVCVVLIAAVIIPFRQTSSPLRRIGDYYGVILCHDPSIFMQPLRRFDAAF